MRRAREQALFDPLPDWCSPLTAGVQLVNLSGTGSGRSLRVDLGDDFGRMLQQLALIGIGFVMTRHWAAMVGRRMAYPVPTVTSGGGKGASGEAGLWLDLRQIGAARAMHLRRETGHVFGVEFADLGENLFHGFTLTPESDMDEFFAWVRLHQACTAHSRTRWPAEKIEASVPEPARSSRRCFGDALSTTMVGCHDRGLPIRVTLASHAVTQRIEFTPHSLRQGDGWWLASDDDHRFQFQPELFGRITVEERLTDLVERRFALRAVTDDGKSLLVESGEAAAKEAWHHLLETVA